MTVPALDTPRLRLRGHRLEDFDHTAALWSDPVVMRLIGRRPLTREESWTRLLRYIGHWTLLGFGYWTIHEIATGRFVGEAGLADYCRAILAWGETRFNSRPTTCVIAPENVRSIRLAQKFGYREVRRAIYQGEPIILFERLGR